MIINDKVPLDIQIDNVGTYGMGVDGAIGKTYVAALLRECSAYNPDSICVISYSANMGEEDYLKLIHNFKGKYLLLDRLDLYVTDNILEALYNKNCIILLDLKNDKYWRKLAPKTAIIEREKTMTTVIGL